MERFLNYLLIAATVCGISFGATACSSSDDENNEPETLTAQTLAGLWVIEYTESGTDGDVSWTRALEDYQLNADGTGYYESYQLDGNKLVEAASVRDNGALHYTISGNTVTVKGDENNMTQTLTYADGKLTAQGRTWQKATAEQQTLVNQLYGDWQASNSDTGKTDDSKLENVDGNVDINNGGGGVNTVR